jgi:hypothetical protein
MAITDIGESRSARLFLTKPIVKLSTHVLCILLGYRDYAPPHGGHGEGYPSQAYNPKSYMHSEHQSWTGPH